MTNTGAPVLLCTTASTTEVLLSVDNLKKYKYVLAALFDSNEYRVGATTIVPRELFESGYITDLVFFGKSSSYAEVISTYAYFKYNGQTSVKAYSRGGNTIKLYGIK